MMAQSTLSILAETGLHEELNFSWKIPNFWALYSAAKSNPDANGKIFSKTEFTVGGKYKGIPTAWQFYLKLHDLDVRRVGIYLELLGTGCHTAEYEVVLKDKAYPSHTRVDRLFKNPKRRFARSNSNSKLEETVSESGLSLGEAGDLFDCIPNNKELELQLKFTVYYTSEEGQRNGNLSTDFKKALDSGVGADFTFVFTEEGSGKVIEKIPAHRTILSIRSPVFATMFASGMIQASKGEVEISDVTPKAMKVLLAFIYTGEMNEEWGDVAAELIHAADKYDVNQLKTFLCENIAPALSLQNAMKIRYVGELYNLPEVVEAATKFMKDNFEQILKNYDFTNITLKNSSTL